MAMSAIRVPRHRWEEGDFGCGAHVGVVGHMVLVGRRADVTVMLQGVGVVVAAALEPADEIAGGDNVVR